MARWRRGGAAARRVDHLSGELSLAPNLTVAENIFLGSELSKNGSVDRRAMAVACMPIPARLGVSFTPRTMVGSLSMAERQLVEIARALHARSRILVMDEPTTSLSSRETDKLFALIRSLRAAGLAIIYISHRMGEVYDLSDRVSVLRDGGYVGTLERKDLSAERLVQMMVGRDLSSFYKKEHDAHQRRGRMILSVRNMGDGRRGIVASTFTRARCSALPVWLGQGGPSLPV
jgi:ribose transport system ATP-binding protein